MNKCWTWLMYVALFALLFIMFPLMLSGNTKSKQLKPVFDDYIKKFNKTYKSNPLEYETRFGHFLVSLAEIDELNAASRGPDEFKARYGLTKLSDMSKTEYKNLHLSDEQFVKSPHVYGRSWRRSRKQISNEIDDEHNHHRKNRPCDETNNVNCIVNRSKRASLPLLVDWRTKGVVGPIQDQGLCGACWAFSTVGVMESMAAMNTSKVVPLSVQEAIDCAGLGNSGCAGGDICLLLDWLLMTGTPVEKSSDYPLRLINGVCRMKKNATGVRVKSYTCDDFVDAEDQILEQLATHGPVAVAVNALTWQNYLGGVIQYHCSGAATDLNHAVELVGYDLTTDVPYYIAKNSWGSEFGNSGYLKLGVGTNICGLANEVASVDVK